MRDDLVRHIEALVLCHSPSGNEAEIDRRLLRQWRSARASPPWSGCLPESTAMN